MHEKESYKNIDTLNPILRGTKSNLFYLREAIYALPMDFTLTGLIIHQKLCYFINIYHEQFVGQKRRELKPGLPLN